MNKVYTESPGHVNLPLRLKYPSVAECVKWDSRERSIQSEWRGVMKFTKLNSAPAAKVTHLGTEGVPGTERRFSRMGRRWQKSRLRVGKLSDATFCELKGNDWWE